MPKRKKILKADDEPEVTRALGKSDFHNSDVGWDREEKPDLVIIDVVMPMVNGYHICEYLKRNEKTKHIPIMLTSGKRIEDSDETKGKAMGADTYLIKPVDLRRLVVEVNTLLQK